MFVTVISFCCLCCILKKKKIQVVLTVVVDWAFKSVICHIIYCSGRVY